MKNSFYASLMMIAVCATSCNNANNKASDTDSTSMDVQTTEASQNSKVVAGEYVDLNTGETVNIVPDPVTGIAINSSTQIPVELYYDPTSKDTLYQSGLVVNNMLIKEKEGKYRLDDTKIKIDGDEIKIKTDSSKLKIDGDETKYKNGSFKTKTDGEDMKIKTPDGKVKVEDGEVKTK